MKTIFFRRYGIFYLPIHAVGWMATLAAIAACVWFFTAIDRNSHSVSDTLIHFFVYASCVAFWWKWLADANSAAE